MEELTGQATESFGDLGTSGQADEAPETTQKAQDVFDLDKYTSKVRYEGREWDPKELKSALMRQQDYSRKTEEIKRERESLKYQAALPYDLEKLRDNPSLIQEFFKTYPPQFHQMARNILRDVFGSQPMQQTQNQIDPQLMSRLEQVEQMLHQKEVQAHEMKIDSLFKEASSKYEYFNGKLAENLAITYAQQQLAKQEEDGVNQPTIDDKTWGRIFKAVNDEIKSAYEGRASNKFNNQKSVGQRSKDIAAGGGIPTQAPKDVKTLKGAREAMLKDAAEGRI